MDLAKDLRNGSSHSRRVSLEYIVPEGSSDVSPNPQDATTSRRRRSFLATYHAHAEKKGPIPV